MKKCITLSLALLFTTYTYAQKSDLARYGLKGNIKTMEQTIFNFCKKISGNWYAVDTPFYTIKIYAYDIMGTLQSIEERHIDVKSKKSDYTLTKYYYANEKLKGAEWFNERNQKLGESKLTWQDDHTYTDLMENKAEQSHSEVIHKLDSRGRTIETISKNYRYNGIEGSSSTKYIYNNGLLSGLVVHDSLHSVVMTYIVIPLKKDELGNATESVLAIDPYSDATPSVLTFSKYEYYNK